MCRAYEYDSLRKRQSPCVPPGPSMAPSPRASLDGLGKQLHGKCEPGVAARTRRSDKEDEDPHRQRGTPWTTSLIGVGEFGCSRGPLPQAASDRGHSSGSTKTPAAGAARSPCPVPGTPKRKPDDMRSTRGSARSMHFSQRARSAVRANPSDEPSPDRFCARPATGALMVVPNRGAPNALDPSGVGGDPPRTRGV